MDFECQWGPLRDPLGRWMGVGLAVAGSLGAALAGWLAGALLLGCRRQRRSAAVAAPSAQLLLLALALAALGRALLAGFPFAAAASLAGRWVFGRGCCVLFAALRLLLEASLRFVAALLAVDRCLLSRRGKKKSPPSPRKCLFAVAGCWAAAAGWTVAPLLGWGRFGCDVSGFWCELDWRSSYGAHSSFNNSFFFFGIVLPEVLAVCCSLVAVSRTSKASSDEDEEMEKEINRVALLTSLGLLLCGLPRTVAQGLLLLGGFRTLPIALRLASPLALEMSTSVTTLALLVAGPGVREWLIGASSGGGSKKHRRPAGAQLLSTRG